MRPDEVIAAFERDEPDVHRARYRELADDEEMPAVWGHGTGTHTTDRSCYEFLAARAPECGVTLETGLGLSTLVLAAAGCAHHAPLHRRAGRGATPGVGSGPRHRSRLHDVRARTVGRVPPGTSARSRRSVHDRRRSRVPVAATRLVLRCGAAQGRWDPRPRRHPSLGPRQLDAFLRLDERWKQLARTEHWSAYRRLVDGPVSEDFDTQPLLPQTTRPNPANMNWKGRLVYRLPAPLREQVSRFAK